jgi:hypothetical protein
MLYEVGRRGLLTGGSQRDTYARGGCVRLRADGGPSAFTRRLGHGDTRCLGRCRRHRGARRGRGPVPDLLRRGGGRAPENKRIRRQLIHEMASNDWSSGEVPLDRGPIKSYARSA